MVLAGKPAISLEGQYRSDEAIPGPDPALHMRRWKGMYAEEARIVAHSNHVAPPDPVPVSGRGGQAQWNFRVLEIASLRSQ